MTSRRQFLKGIMAGVATVAVGLRVATGPKEIFSDWGPGMEPLRFKATERYSTAWADPRGVFGSPGT